MDRECIMQVGLAAKVMQAILQPGWLPPYTGTGRVSSSLHSVNMTSDMDKATDGESFNTVQQIRRPCRLVRRQHWDMSSKPLNAQARLVLHLLPDPSPHSLSQTHSHFLYHNQSFICQWHPVLSVKYGLCPYLGHHCNTSLTHVPLCQSTCLQTLICQSLHHFLIKSLV